MPPTRAVNPNTQCMAPGCGTMLLTDGTCPRCDPPSRRTTVDKLRLAEEYKDDRLQTHASREIEAGVATGVPSARPSLRDDPDALISDQQMVQIIDELERRLSPAIDAHSRGLRSLHDKLDALTLRVDRVDAPPPPPAAPPKTEA